MTDAVIIPPKTDPPPAETPPPSDTFTIEVKGLEGLPPEQQKQITDQIAAIQKQSNATVAALTKQIDTLTKKVDKAEAKSDDTQKAVLLKQLKDAKYDPEGFKTLDLTSLQTVVKGIGKTNTGIVLPNKEGKEDPSFNPHQALVRNMKTGKREAA